MPISSPLTYCESSLLPPSCTHYKITRASAIIIQKTCISQIKPDPPLFIILNVIKHPSFFYHGNNTWAFLADLIRTRFKMVPEGIGTTSGWSHRIDGTFFFYPLKKNTFQAILGDTLPAREPVANTLKIFLHEINAVHLQEFTNPAHLELTDPDITRFPTTTRAWTGITGTGIKCKIKTIHLDNIHFSLTLY